ncbi:hypothetical protein CDD83_10151 [Cordyceps sp. RAO-2017]|nr:hypothetical protein CDD83_10151 [Cordyceps sp. RAO-2017]
MRPGLVVSDVTSFGGQPRGDVACRRRKRVPIPTLRGPDRGARANPRIRRPSQTRLCGPEATLDPPLAVPPVLKSWRYPAHVDDILIDVPSLAPAHRFRKLKGSQVITPALSRGPKNNGHTEIGGGGEAQGRRRRGHNTSVAASHRLEAMKPRAPPPPPPTSTAILSRIQTFTRGSRCARTSVHELPIA